MLGDPFITRLLGFFALALAARIAAMVFGVLAVLVIVLTLVSGGSAHACTCDQPVAAFVAGSSRAELQPAAERYRRCDGPRGRA